MPTSWNDAVRQTGQLSVRFNAQIRNSSVWKSVAQSSINQFNRLSRRYRLGVKLVATTASSANVIVNLVNGKTSFSYDNNQHTVSLSGKGLHGLTYKLNRSGRIVQAYVFLPSGPQISIPAGQRGVGNGIKLVIAVHEFIHCCGLSESEHSNNDIFVANPSTDYGSTPQRDVVVIQAKRGRQRKAPPLFLGSTTASHIRAVWPVQRRSSSPRRKRASFLQDGVQTSSACYTGDVRGVQRQQGPVGIA